ncbi:hypothetical protein HHK36_011594 [Tetracentron sinense]|uniref:Uncharacterized protein n=1 Tax=Tetracentron sinense TaxID=13715 RepID=A0A834ZAM3_TETSI|nr:hypothetical protein HHK36_011594 [Tetracentron sinense]
MFSNTAAMGVNIKPKLEMYAVVTGANKGIGLEIVRKLACEGVTVVLTARDEERGKEATSSLVESGFSNVVFHQLDVQDPVSVERFAKFVQTRLGRLDILVTNQCCIPQTAPWPKFTDHILQVNNAGASGVVVDEAGLKALNIDPVSWLSGKATNLVQGVIQQTYEKAEECLDTNYYGCQRVTEALIPLLQLSNSGARIVNVSSLRGELKRIPNEQTRNILGDVDTLTEDKLNGILQSFLHDLRQDELEANGWTTMVPAYSISKATLNAYTRVLAKRYPDMCINCVHPGYVNTDINWHTGTMTVEEGARGPVMLALLPAGGPSGCYFDQTELSEF